MSLYLYVADTLSLTVLPDLINVKHYTLISLTQHIPTGVMTIANR